MRPSPHLLTRLIGVVGEEILVRRGLIAPSQTVGHHGMLSESDRLFCAHVRVGRNPTLPMDEELDMIGPEDLVRLRDFFVAGEKPGQERGRVKYFVATDSHSVRQQFREFFPRQLVDYGGKILHIDRQRTRSDACEGFEEALLDQLILSICDVLVVSRSGFSIHAAHVTNTTGGMWITEGGEISKFVW